MSRRREFKAYLEYLFMLSKYKKHLKSIESYVGFIGYPRSGHSLIGSILDAHPNTIISHELDALGKLQRSWTGNRLFCEMLKNSISYARKGRSETGYSYDVPNQYQGRFETLKVIGDNKGGKSTLRLQEDPFLIESLERLIDKPVQLIHVIRNPFDNISSIYRRDRKRLGLDFEGCIHHYFQHCKIISEFKLKFPSRQIFDMKSEDFIQDSKGELRKLCDFLELQASESYVSDCSQIVFPSPSKSRKRYEWNDNLVELVNLGISRFSFLQGYSYDS